MWSSTANWRELPGGTADPTYTADAQGVYRADNHGWFIATSGDRVFQDGPVERRCIGSARPAPAASRRPGPGARAGRDERQRGSLRRQQDPGRRRRAELPRLERGQRSPIRSTSAATSPKVTSTATMANARAFANSVALPTGDVLTIGGAELRCPVHGLDIGPDARVVEHRAPAAGRRWHRSLSRGTTTPCGPAPRRSCLLRRRRSVRHLRHQSPRRPDLQPSVPVQHERPLRTRPAITSAPSSAQTGQTISVTTNGPITSFVLMRYGEATHTVDNDQRRIPLTIASSSGNTYKLTIPSDPGIALPGPYMLFALNSAGTPSVAPTIFIKTPRCVASRCVWQGRRGRRTGDLLATQRLGWLDGHR